MSVNTNIKIENCPFCGGKSKVYAYLGKYYAKCIKCKTYSAPYDTPEEAAAAWNKRYYAVRVDLEKLQEIPQRECRFCIWANFKHEPREGQIFCTRWAVHYSKFDMCYKFKKKEG